MPVPHAPDPPPPAPLLFRTLWEQPEPCPYREGYTARLPLRRPNRLPSPEEFDRLLSEGDRRSGRMLYRTSCPACTACEPLRVPVDRFTPTRSQRRAARANGDVELRVGRPALTRERLELYNRHKLERGLSRSGEPMSDDHYRAWLLDTCADTREFTFLVAGRIVAVSIIDLGREAASSVYHYFDPDEAKRSLGVYSVLREIEWCREVGLRWYYLGLYVEECQHLRYKASYWPHQRLVNGAWVEFSPEPPPADQTPPPR